MKDSCMECGKWQRVKGMKFYKGKRLCHNCFVKETHGMNIKGFPHGALRSDKEVQKQIKNVNTFYLATGGTQSMVSLPSNYVNKKVKVIIVGEQDEKEEVVPKGET